MKTLVNTNVYKLFVLGRKTFCIITVYKLSVLGKNISDNTKKQT